MPLITLLSHLQAVTTLSILMLYFPIHFTTHELLQSTPQSGRWFSFLVSFAIFGLERENRCLTYNRANPKTFSCRQTSRRSFIGTDFVKIRRSVISILEEFLLFETEVQQSQEKCHSILPNFENVLVLEKEYLRRLFEEEGNRDNNIVSLCQGPSFSKWN
ncbi:hypothetical protein L6452_32129 [Arctium lappa]|uniref:Uncharacterized protein n=1 Tax=Arctium lappa TaxID=4217 RepID=A0ACB8Z3M6_ARCLA|nr:hypothetical protein L6452_32129 [Arctium lappa]